MDSIKQIIFPRLKGKGCYVEARLNRVVDESTDYEFDMPAAETATLDRATRCLLDVGGVEMEYSDSEGIMTANAVQIALADRKKYGYTSDGVHTDVVCPAGESLLQQAFKDTITAGDVKSFVLWLSIIKPDGSVETYFTGDAVGETVNFLQTMVHMPHTADEDQLHDLKLSFTAGSERLKKKLIKDIPWDSSDFTGAAKAWFIGLQNLNIDGNAANLDTVYNLLTDHHDNIKSLNYNYDLGSYYLGGTAFFKAVKLSRIVVRMAQAAGLQCDEATVIESALTFYITKFSTSTGWTPEVVADPGDIMINWNIIFGKHPKDESTISTPATWKPDMTLSNALKLLCNFLGAHAQVTVDQTTKQMALTLKSRRASGVAMPTNWRLKRGSKQEPTKISKNLVEGTNLGFSTKLCVPSDQGDGVKLEIPFSAKQFGGSFGATSITSADMIWQRGKGPLGQPDVIDFSDYRTGALTQDGWIAGALAFVLDSDLDHYPSWTESDNLAIDDFNGFYALSYCDTGELAAGGIADPNRANTLFAQTQLAAQETLGKRLVVSREYHGCLDDTGSLVGVQLGLESTFRYRGVVRDWRATYLNLDPLRNGVKARWEEIPATVYTDLPHKFVDGEQQKASVNSTGNAGTTGIPSSGEDAVALYPKKPVRNRIKPQAADVPAIVLDAHASQTASMLQVEDGGVTKLDIFKNGKIEGASTLSGDDPSTHTTKDYVDAALAAIDLSGYVKLAPSASQTITLSNTAHTFGITAAGGSNGTHRPFRLNNSAGTEVSGGDGFGRFVTKQTILSTLSSNVVGWSLIMASGQTANPVEIYDNGAVLKFAITPKGGLYFQGDHRGPIRTITSATTLGDTDYVVLANSTAGAFTVSLPAASTCPGREYCIKRINAGANNVTIDPNGSETIDGNLTWPLASQWSFIRLISNGTAWFSVM